MIDTRSAPIEPLAEPAVIAAALGVTESTLAQWRAGGRGPRSYKVGGRVRYRPSDVEAWLQARRINGSAA